jgi:exopolysaccharide biosynthesis polyprenyl glycosylphosphotransferase
VRAHHGYASVSVTAPDEELSLAAAVPAGDAAVSPTRAPAGVSARQRIFAAPRWTFVCALVDAALLGLGNVAALVGASAAETAVEDAYLIWLFPPLVIALLAAGGLYRDRIQLRIVDGIGRLLAATSLAGISLIAAAALLDPAADPAQLVVRAWLFGTAYVAGGRVLLAWAQRRARATRLIAKPTLIVGAGQVGARVERRLVSEPELGLLPVGYLDADPPPESMAPDRRAPVLGAPADISRVAAETGARHVVLGFSSSRDQDLIPLVRECEARGIDVSLVPRMFESVNVHVALEHLGGLPLFGLQWINPKGWQFVVKHTLDRVGAALLLAALSPLMLAVAVAVKLSSPGPVLFRQRRIGRDGRVFEMLKFRSMREESPVRFDEPYAVGDVAPGGVEGEDRRTRIGAYLRRTSLDELPQLFNVLRGEMSLVGPRPERPEWVARFEGRVRRYEDRHRVKSGITGWAQVSGLRGKTSLPDRVEWDNWYIENWSLSLDLKILLMTLAALVNRAE